MELNKQLISELCIRNDIDLLLVFGSVARGEDTSGSDIDLIARFKEPKSLFDLVRIEREFTEALGRKVDLLTEASISRHIKAEVLAEAKVIFETAA